jgi:hypothetical protein
VLVIKVKEAVCELKLSLKQEETQMHFIEAIQELDNSPVGCLLSSCLYLCREIHYPFLRNCHDIVQYLSEHKTQGTSLEAAIYVLERLNESGLAQK